MTHKQLIHTVYQQMLQTIADFEYDKRHFDAEGNPLYDAEGNALTGIYAGGKADSFADGVRKAAELIDSGAATKVLDAFIEESN